MKPIDIEEAHQILLDIAKAFTKVCDENNIPYYMLGGTMLGAVRHKGFIPWDDDMDFGVPREYYDLLINVLEKELPSPYRCCTYKNGVSSSVIFKVDNSRTVINDACGKDANQELGLNIDIFPLDYCAPTDTVWKKQKFLTFVYRAKFAKNANWSFGRRVVNKLFSIILPWSKEEINMRKENMLKNLPQGDYLSNVFGAWGTRECIPVEWYGKGVKYKFEDTEFCGPAEFDKYLSQLYGDYMTPPKGDKHIHLDGVYWKD